MSNLPQAFLVQVMTPGRTQVLQSRQKLTIKRLAIQKDTHFYWKTIYT